MDYRLLIKRLDMPAGFSPPARLVHREVVATAITHADLQDDVRGINASRIDASTAVAFKVIQGRQLSAASI